jgi:hypothetical protein
MVHTGELLMQPITITAIVDDKRRIMIDLPDDVPIGLIKITLEQAEDIDSLESGSREWIHAKLLAAGLLAENVLSAEEIAVAEELSEEEEAELAARFAGGRSIHELIDEDRQERF